jgi:hypothetical protein
MLSPIVQSRCNSAYLGGGVILEHLTVTTHPTCVQFRVGICCENLIFESDVGSCYMLAPEYDVLAICKERWGGTRGRVRLLYQIYMITIAQEYARSRTKLITYRVVRLE